MGKCLSRRSRRPERDECGSSSETSTSASAPASESEPEVRWARLEERLQCRRKKPPCEPCLLRQALSSELHRSVINGLLGASFPDPRGIQELVNALEKQRSENRRLTNEPLADVVVRALECIDQDDDINRRKKSKKKQKRQGPSFLSEESICRQLSVLRLPANRVRVHFVEVTDVGADARRSLRGLVSLSLAGNWLRDVAGDSLPRGLRILELHDNLLSDLRALLDPEHRPPSRLLHLGLGRNLLHDETTLDLISAHGSCLKRLRSLDLVDNNLTDLVRVVNALKALPALRVLGLRGNPCSLVPAYPKLVRLSLHGLLYLDMEEFPLQKSLSQCNISDEKVKELEMEGSLSAVLKIKVTDVRGIPKELKKYRVDVELPLLVLNLGQEEKNCCCWFSTETKAWAPVMDFPEIRVIVRVSQLRRLRDTFRTTVRARLMRLKLDDDSSLGVPVSQAEMELKAPRWSRPMQRIETKSLLILRPRSCTRWDQDSVEDLSFRNIAKLNPAQLSSVTMVYNIGVERM